MADFNRYTVQKKVYDILVAATATGQPLEGVTILYGPVLATTGQMPAVSVGPGPRDRRVEATPFTAPGARGIEAFFGLRCAEYDAAGLQAADQQLATLVGKVEQVLSDEANITLGGEVDYSEIDHVDIPTDRTGTDPVSEEIVRLRVLKQV